MEPEIVFEDEDIIVCHKPGGMATETSRMAQQDMVSWLKNRRAARNEESYVGVVHRLDQPVEGLLVFARHPKAAAALSRQLQNGVFHKRYYAVVSGARLPENGILEDYIIKDSAKRCACKVSASHPGARPARLSYRRIAEAGDRQLLDIELHTGRFHQIRLQLSDRQAPILGDTKYGGQPVEGGLCLCAYRLGFFHPSSGVPEEFEIVPGAGGFAMFFSK